MTISQKTLIAFVLLFNLVIGTHAQEATIAHKDSLTNLVRTYYELNVKAFQAGSSIKDIDNIFSLFTKNFTYTHPKYGGTYTRQDLYDGYVNNQKNGSYNGSVTDIEIINKIIGLNAATVQKRFLMKTDQGVKKGEPEMTLFEFEKGKISKIVEYW